MRILVSEDPMAQVHPVLKLTRVQVLKKLLQLPRNLMFVVSQSWMLVKGQSQKMPWMSYHL